MTLPQVINLLRDLTEEAEQMGAHEGVTWLNEARRAIVEAWDKEMEDEASEMLAIAQEQAWRDNDRERRGEGRPRW